MVEISFLTGSDRTRWEVLARGHDAHGGVERGDEAYERTWQRLLGGGEQAIGIGARLDGRLVGIAHYVFHAGIWGNARCYLADLFVDAEVRRRGVATAMIEWVARDAERNGFPRLYWNTPADSPARALYDKVAKISEGLVVYTYRPEATGDLESSVRPGEFRSNR
ncbi:GNAT family N-acetyltransferase [Amycolatopsis oliviviridis]|uniref:N-acetyltransferase n=1 Tax=Amycolatopsis oliviviridis TaxID=1471590 RepID=A0ABQ3M6Z2_9PSEU|nr:GNAT family N-acetyltransferase [Amycolatopsis oliviviridis]GHH34556.1 N-acetyltransferase [Amycolatopsis oliviviridis]